MDWLVATIIALIFLGVFTPFPEMETEKKLVYNEITVISLSQEFN